VPDKLAFFIVSIVKDACIENVTSELGLLQCMPTAELGNALGFRVSLERLELWNITLQC
jgi:hypothetical protein